MAAKKTEIDYGKIVEIYNTNGKQKADEYIQETYKLTVDYVYQRLVKAGYTYNRTHKKYVLSSGQSSDGTPNFLSLEALLEPMPQPHSVNEKSFWEQPNYSNEIDTLVMELIKDKLLQLNHFMKINHHSKTVLLHRTALLKEGYKIIEC